MLYILTLDEMKDALGIKDADDDAQVTALIEGLQARADQECNRHFLYASGIEEFFDGGKQWLMVNRFPIASVASVHVDPDRQWTADTLLETTGYACNKQRGRIVYGIGEYYWPNGFQHIRVVYSGGLVTDSGVVATGADSSELDSLKRALKMQGNFEWRNKQSLGVQSIGQQGMNVSLAKAELLPEVKAILNGLRRF